MLVAAVHDPLAGSYRSTDARRPLPSKPPVTSTVPSSSRVAVWRMRGAAKLSAAVQLPGLGVRSGVGDGATEDSGVALGPKDSVAPTLEVADGDGTAHPLTTRRKAVPARVVATRWVVRRVMSGPAARVVQLGGCQLRFARTDARNAA